MNIPNFLFLNDNDNKYFEKLKPTLENNNDFYLNEKKKFSSQQNINLVLHNLNEKINKNCGINRNVNIINSDLLPQFFENIFYDNYSLLNNNRMQELNRLNHIAIDKLYTKAVNNLKLESMYKKDKKDITHIYDKSLLPECVNSSGTNYLNTAERYINLYE